MKSSRVIITSILTLSGAMCSSLPAQASPSLGQMVGIVGASEVLKRFHLKKDPAPTSNKSALPVSSTPPINMATQAKKIDKCYVNVIGIKLCH